MANVSRDEFGGPTHADTVYVGGTSETVLFDAPVKYAVSTVAATGNSQATAAALSGIVTYVTAADGTKGVVLPAAVEGLCLEVYNVATSVLPVYPASGDDINDGTTNASITLQPKTKGRFFAIDGTTWAAQWSTDWSLQDTTLADGVDVAVNATTGTKLATGATQKLGFWNTTPVVQQTAGTDVTATTVGTNTGTSDVGLSSIGDTSGGDVSGAIMNDFVALQEDIAAMTVLANRINTDLKTIGVTIAP